MQGPPGMRERPVAEPGALKVVADDMPTVRLVCTEQRELHGRWDSELITAWAASPGFEIQVAIRDPDEEPGRFTVSKGPIVGWALVRTLGRELREYADIEPVFYLPDYGHTRHESELRRLWDGFDVRCRIVALPPAA